MADEKTVEKVKGKALPLPMLLGITFVAAIGVSVVLMTVIFKGMMPKEKSAVAPVAEEEPAFESVIAHYPLPTFRCNLKGGGYLKATIVLELADNSVSPPMPEAVEGKKKKGEGEEKKGEGGGHGGGETKAPETTTVQAETPSPFVQFLGDYRAKFQDIILTILTGHTKDDVLAEDGKLVIKKEIKDGINRELNPQMGLVKNVFFEEFVTD